MPLQNLIRHDAPRAARLAEQIVTLLLESFELLGRELGDALLLQPPWLNAGAALAPLSACADDA
jgi:hypothetical protein